MPRTATPMSVPLTPATDAVLAALLRTGGHPYLVGGCVRDAIVRPGQTPKDIDIEVFGISLEDALAALRTVGRVDEVGRAFSVLALRVGNESFDVSLPRRDTKTGAGHTGFISVPDPNVGLEQATARRDLTINALMYDPVTQSVIDCWDGLGDLRTKTLRHTTERFVEDPLRVMRAVGFVARFGFTMHPSTVALSRSIVHSADELVMKRMWQEWHKIAAKGTFLAEALETLHATGWDAHFPHLAALRAVEQDAHWHPEGNVFTHSGLAASKAAALADEAGLEGDDRVVVVLAALVHDFGKVTHTQVETDAEGRRRVRSKGHAPAGVDPAMGFLSQIGAPRSIRERVAPLVREHMASTGAKVSASVVRRLARRLAPATLAEWALVVEADKGGRGAGSISGETAPWLAVATTLGAERAPRPSILRGRHLIEDGMTPGPAFKAILERALAAQDEGEFGDEAGALAWLRAQSVLTD